MIISTFLYKEDELTINSGIYNLGPMDIGEIFRRNVKDLRKQRGFTQEMLAEFAGLSLRGVQTVEYGDNWPEQATVKKLAKALGVAEDRLFLDPRKRPELTPAEALLALGKFHGFEIKPIKPRNRKPSK